MFSAFSLMSKPHTCHMGQCCLRAMAMHPLPVPISATRSGVDWSHFLIIHSTSSAVSGRGMRVSDVTRRSRPIQRVCPKICWMGLCVRSCSMIAFRLGISAALVAVMICVRVIPVASSMIQSANSRNSSSGYVSRSSEMIWWMSDFMLQRYTKITN